MNLRPHLYDFFDSVYCDLLDVLVCALLSLNNKVHFNLIKRIIVIGGKFIKKKLF